MIFTLVSGLATGGTYAIFAIGYTLVFSILGIINFAHAAVFTLGAYFTYVLMGRGINAGLLKDVDFPFEMTFYRCHVAGGVVGRADQHPD